jgi:FkbM family methyltransferase
VMLSPVIKILLKRLFRAMGVECRRISAAETISRSRESLFQLLEQAKAVGLSPNCIIDVGAAYGSFTRQCLEIFPDALYVLVEPLVEYEPMLTRLCKDHPGIRCVYAAAAASSSKAQLNVHPDLVGSSLFREVEEGTDVNGVPRTVDTVTVDEIVRESGFKGPFLMKIDVQGAELDVLRGAERTLQESDYVLIEVSFFKFFENGPEVGDVIAYMKERGFVPYDLFAIQYRPVDHALSQVDLAFVKERGRFRRHHFYATPQQRAEQNQRMKIHLADLFARGQ